MKHLYRNEHGGGEIVAADTLKEAAHYHDCHLGGQDAPDVDWVQVPDNDQVTINLGVAGDVTRYARDWAGDHQAVVLVGTMYT